MTEEEWLTHEHIFSEWHFLKDEKYRRRWDLFAIACLRRFVPRITEESLSEYFDLYERAVDGLATHADVEAVWHRCLSALQDLDPQPPFVAFVPAISGDPVDMDLEELTYACASLAEAEAAMSPESTAMQTAMALDNEHRRWTSIRLDIFGNPFRPVAFDPSWRTSTAVAIARGMYDSRDFSAMPILADALQDAGCEHADILDHCRSPGPHVKGCWVVDLVLGKE